MHETERTEGTGEDERGQEIRRPGELEPQLRPRIYVASLSDYNSGCLHGTWLDAAVEDAELWTGVQAMLAASSEPGAEEFAIHDYENFGPYRIREYEPLEVVTRIARGIEAHGPAFAHWATLVGGLDEDALGRFDESYQGHFEGMNEYGDSVIEGFGLEKQIEALPEHLQAYVHVDAAAFTRDMELEGLIMTSEGDGGVYVFGVDW
jgi:antirestriction protein